MFKDLANNNIIIPSISNPALSSLKDKSSEREREDAIALNQKEMLERAEKGRRTLNLINQVPSTSSPGFQKGSELNSWRP